MSLEALLSQTVTILRLSQSTLSATAEGDPTASTPAQVSSRALIQQRDATEIQVGPDTLISNHILFLPAGTAIDGRDQVSESGRLFEVIAAPDVVRTPRGAHHLEVALRLITT